jgi:hypothetical protein
MVFDYNKSHFHFRKSQSDPLVDFMGISVTSVGTVWVVIDTSILQFGIVNGAVS